MAQNFVGGYSVYQKSATCQTVGSTLLKLIPWFISLTSAVLITYDLAEASRDSNSFETCLPRTVGGILLLTVTAAGFGPWLIHPIMSQKEPNGIFPEKVSFRTGITIMVVYLAIVSAVSWIALFSLIFMLKCEQKPSSISQALYFTVEALIIPFGLYGVFHMLCYVFSEKFRRQLSTKQSIMNEEAVKRTFQIRKAIASKQRNLMKGAVLKFYTKVKEISSISDLEVQYINFGLRKRMTPSLAKLWEYSPKPAETLADHPLLREKPEAEDLRFSKATFPCNYCGENIEILDSCTRVDNCKHTYHWECYRCCAIIHFNCFGCKSPFTNERVIEYFHRQKNIL